jgi:hypothetical protein
VISRTVSTLTGLLLLAGATGCGTGPQDTYTQNNGSYLRLPGQWELFSGTDIVRAQDPEAALADGVDMRGFALGTDDAAVVLNSSDTPAGLLLTAAIPEGVTAEMDRAVVITNLNELIGSGGATVVEEFAPITAGDGARGERGTFDVPDLDGDVMRLTQLTVTDEDRTRVWVLIVGCSTECHERQKGLVNEIATTWKVEPKR